MPSILCIENEPSAGVIIESSLAQLGHQALLAPSLDEAFRVLERQPVDLIISEQRISGAGGGELLDRLRRDDQTIPVILTGAHASVEEVVLSLKRGAADFLAKPIRLETLRSAVERALDVCRLQREVDGRSDESGSLARGRRIIGDTPLLAAVRETIRCVAPTRVTVLLHGETGTGKELFARSLHEQSPRRGQPFVVVNCAAIPEALVESTLFGHERGAFTGAVSRFPGAFERAHRGTLLLDEVSEMRLDLQAKLLRAIQEREFERVGGTQPIQVDVRVVATTNRDLRGEVASGRFRQDLYYRLSVVPIRLPALRDRVEDVPLLVRHFVEQFAAEMGIRAPRVPRETLEQLKSRLWPGNVRELENAVERAVILDRSGELRPESFLEPGGPVEPPGLGPGLPAITPNTPGAVVALSSAPVLSAGTSGSTPIGPTANASIGQPETVVFRLRELERLAIQRALASTNGHRARAARLLGISERTLRNKLNTDRVESPEEEPPKLAAA